MAKRVSCCALASFAAGIVASVFSATARAADPPATLPISRVVLFTSGVGFFEHQGKVTGDAEVDLKFNVADINDLLKSMVLEDRGGGKISTVTYGSRDPVSKTLKTFSVDLTQEPSVGDLLRQVRGERVTVELPMPVTGKILGIETREQQVGKDEVVEVEMLNLVTATGLRSVALNQAGEIRLENERLNAELQDALAILTQSHSRDKKNVTLRFAGAGERPVRVGYIQESPLWKTSYRLVLREGEAPLMQGWAIVENTTEHDWRDVRLTLVNGRPISFIMDLYQPLYVARPVVAPETFASLRPQLHAQDLAAGDALQKANAGNRGRGMGGMGGGMMGGMGGGMGGGVAPAADADMPDLALQIDPSAGVEAAAKGSDVGELFRYEIDEPIKLARQQSAMLPIINGKVTGEKVSLFNGSVESKHPLDAVQLTNSTPLHWMQGPITVFDGGEYAGDARIEDLAPGGQRLISYALDLDTEVSSDSTERPKEMISAQLQSGRLIVRHRLRRLHIYTVKNSSERAKKVLIEQPIDADWKLVGTRPAEQTRSLYRFAVQAEPGKPERLVVEEEQPVEEQLFAAALADPQDAQIFLKSDVVSDEVKQAIAEVVRRNQARAKLAARMTDLDKRIHLFTGEQERIRENMKTLDHDSDLYRRFVKKLGVQEDEIEKIRAELEQLKSRQQELDTDLEKYLSDLKLD